MERDAYCWQDGKYDGKFCLSNDVLDNKSNNNNNNKMKGNPGKRNKLENLEILKKMCQRRKK